MKSLTSLFLTVTFLYVPLTHSMLRRPAQRISPSSSRVHPTNRNTQFPPHRYYSNSEVLKKLDKQIAQCQESEREFLQHCQRREHIISDCLIKGTCLGAKCTEKSNCLLSGQMTYLAWKQAEKETATYEIARSMMSWKEANKKFKPDNLSKT